MSLEVQYGGRPLEIDGQRIPGIEVTHYEDGSSAFYVKVEKGKRERFSKLEDALLRRKQFTGLEDVFQKSDTGKKISHAYGKYIWYLPYNARGNKTDKPWTLRIKPHGQFRGVSLSFATPEEAQRERDRIVGTLGHTGDDEEEEEEEEKEVMSDVVLIHEKPAWLE